jgi:hypothetical protein
MTGEYLLLVFHNKDVCLNRTLACIGNLTVCETVSAIQNPNSFNRGNDANGPRFSAISRRSRIPVAFGDRTGAVLSEATDEDIGVERDHRRLGGDNPAAPSTAAVISSIVTGRRRG